MRHLIRQQYLQVEYSGSESEALALQRRLNSFCRDYLIPAMEVTLNQNSYEDQHLCLERLEIDAGSLPLERLEYDLTDSVTRALEKSLKEELSPAKGPPPVKSTQQSITEAFLYFLATGSLPWSFRLPAHQDLEQATLGCWQKGDPSGRLSRTLQHAAPGLLASDSVCTRLVLQFSELFLETLLALLSPDIAETVKSVLAKVGDSPINPAALTQFRMKLWETAFAGVAKGGMLPAPELVTEAWRTLRDSAPEHGALVAELERHWPGLSEKGTTAPNTLAIDEPIIGDAGNALPEQRAYSGSDKIKEEEHPDAREGIYVDNAGMVLLHPFLPQLFETLQIAQGEELLQPERALGLLHFLSTGRATAPEYLVMLPKVLCNIALQSPVESDLALTAAEQEECTNLLEAVIRHWGALGSCSPDGLRGTFLLRPGKLSLRQDGDWLLQVESSSCDILMEQLPWGLAMVKLPWMPKMLWVEWN